MLWYTLFLLCIALELITGTGWLLLISLGALSSAIVGFFLPISQEANICFFASISILASIIKFFYDKKHCIFFGKKSKKTSPGEPRAFTF